MAANPDIDRFGRDLISALGGSPTPAALKLFRAQQQWEGGWTNNNAAYNPLNRTDSGFPKINSVGVAAYPNYQTGVKRTAELVRTGYPSLASALSTGKVNFQDPGLQGDFNRWLTGKRTPGMTPYVSKIAGSFGAPPGSAPVASTPTVPSSTGARAGAVTPGPAGADHSAALSMISSLLGGNRQDTFGEPLQLLAALGARRQQSRSQELPVQPATTLPKPQFGEIGKATGPYPYSPLGGAKYRPLGAPGQGTHSTGEGPDNWQSDNAWDYGADPGTPVYATDSGVVTGGYGESASSGRFGGSRVNISGGQRPGGEFYQHLAPNLAVKPGEKVTVGQLIGYVGKVPGLGPHLHYGQERL